MVSSSANQLDAASIDLMRRVRGYLVQHGFPALRTLDVEACNGTVSIRGRVGSYYEKQLCLNCCRRVAGVIQLVDCVQVV